MNRKKFAFFGLVAALALLFAMNASAQTSGMSMAVIGAPVQNTLGHRLGEVDNLIFGPSGQISYLILSQVPGASNRLIMVPFDMASFNAPQDIVILRGVNRSMLDSAPFFTAADWQRINQPGFMNQVRSYYGQAAPSYAPSGTAPRGYSGAEVAPGTYPKSPVGTSPTPVQPAPETRIGPHGYIYGTPRNPWNLPPEGYVGPAPGSSGSTMPYGYAPQNY